jgi:hypothetical protein
MPNAYVIEVAGRTAGIVARDSQNNSFNSAVPRFNAIEGQRFSDPLAAESAARMLAKYGSLPRPAKRNIQRTSRNEGSASKLRERECLADFAEGGAFGHAARPGSGGQPSGCSDQKFRSRRRSCYATSSMCCEENRRSGSLSGLLIVWFLPDSMELRRAL